MSSCATLSAMDAVDPDLVEKITALACDLPEIQRRALFDLIASWKPDVRQAPRETYTELLNFESCTGSHYGHARDISTTGVFIVTPAEFDLGEHIQLMLTFISAPNPIHLSGKIVRKTADGVGVHFDAVSRSRVAELDTIISKHVLILRQP